jgi:quercetin dioxygenase-like cupin family protein
VSEDAVLLPPGRGERIENPLGGEIVFKARSAETAGSLTVFEAVNPPGQGPPYHVHDALDEVIFVLGGSLRVRLADKVEQATAGAFVFIPRGLPHTWEGHGDEAVRFLVVLAPAGLEEFFENTAAAGGAQASDAFSRFGGDDLKVLGPPLAVTHPPTETDSGSDHTAQP